MKKMAVLHPQMAITHFRRLDGGGKEPPALCMAPGMFA